MKTISAQYTGAFGATEVSFAPRSRWAFEFDVKNCPHCGVHHASLDGIVQPNGRVLVRCPSLGGRPIEIIIKLFLNVP